jgi:hypothetical protein
VAEAVEHIQDRLRERQLVVAVLAAARPQVLLMELQTQAAAAAVVEKALRMAVETAVQVLSSSKFLTPIPQPSPVA